MSAWTRLVSWYSSTRTWSNWPASTGSDGRVAHRRPPVEEEVLEVEQVLGPLAPV